MSTTTVSSAETLRETFELACPKCGQAEELDVQITCMARVTADGADPYGDQEWDDTSSCRCSDCGHSGTVKDFRAPHVVSEDAGAKPRHAYLFDAKLFASLRVTASRESEARRILAALIDCATIDCGALADGSPLTAEASLDGELDLVEIDGEPAF